MDAAPPEAGSGGDQATGEKNGQMRKKEVAEKAKGGAPRPDTEPPTNGLRNIKKKK